MSGGDGRDHYGATEFWQEMMTDASRWTAEQYLVVAVIHRAALDAVDHRLPEHVRREARRWVASHNTRPWSARWAFDVIFSEGGAGQYRRFARVMIRRAEESDANAAANAAANADAAHDENPTDDY